MEQPDDKLVSVFVRHGETALNASDSFRGPMDIPLSSQGIQDAKDVANFLKPTTFGNTYSSDMQRTVHTSEAILEPRGMAATTTPDLRSWNVGHFAGLPKAGTEFQIKYYQDNPNESIPEGESLHNFRGRVQPRIKTAIVAGTHTGVPSLVVTHSSVIHELSHMVYGDHEAVKV